MDGVTLRLIRAIHGLDRYELAQRLGCSHTLVSYLESGKRRITESVEQRIRNEFQLTDKEIRDLQELARSANRGRILGNIPRRGDY